jgi:transposase
MALRPKAVRSILDDDAARKHPKALKWRAHHPRWTFHFAPTSSSWLNSVEGFFAKHSPKAQAWRLPLHLGLLTFGALAR